MALNLLIGLPGERPGGLALTIIYFAAAGSGALIAGYVYAVISVALPRASLPLQTASAFVRGIPLLLLVFLWAQASGLPLGAVGLAALLLYSFAHVGETLRSFLAAYPADLSDQARVMGIGRVRDWLELRAPWTLWRAWGAVATHWVSLLKDTGALVVLGIGELTTVARAVSETPASADRWAATLSLAAALYLAATLALIWAIRIVERRTMRWAGAESPGAPKAMLGPLRWIPETVNIDRRAAAIGVSLLALGALAALMAACSGRAGAAGSASGFETIKQRGVLRAGIRYDNPPHSFIDEQGRWVGFDMDIADALARELGVSLERVKVDELTRISYLKEGKVDIAVASMSHTVKRDREIDFSQTYFWSKQTFLVRKGEVQSLRDLVSKSVGMSRGSHSIGNWRAWLSRNGHPADPEIVEFSDKRAAMEAVRQGSIAGWAEDYEILASFARQNPSLEVLGGEGIGMKQDGIGIRENDSRLRDEINFALQRITASGEYDRIYDQWFGPQSDTPVPLESRIEVWPGG